MFVVESLWWFSLYFLLSLFFRPAFPSRKQEKEGADWCLISFLPVHLWGSHKSREESNYTLSHFLVFRSSPLWTISSLWVIEIRGFCPAPMMRRHGEFGQLPFPLFPFPQACGWNEFIWFVWTDYFDWKTRVDISPCLWERLKIRHWSIWYLWFCLSCGSAAWRAARCEEWTMPWRGVLKT